MVLKLIDMENNKFIDCALQQKYISLKNINECKEIQKNFPSLSIEQILKTHGFIDDGKCNAINAILKYKNEEDKPRVVTSVKRKKDKDAANVLLKEGFIDSDKLLKLTDLQKKLENEGQKYPLINIAIAKNILWENGHWDNWYAKDENVNYPNIIYLIAKGVNRGKAYLIDIENFSISLIGEKEWTIGRFPSNQIIVQESVVSRIHCKLIFEKDHWVIADLMSSSGVFLNKERIVKKILHHEDKIKIGSKLFDIKIN